jgi:hypothetical protein
LSQFNSDGARIAGSLNGWVFDSAIQHSDESPLCWIK